MTNDTSTPAPDALRAQMVDTLTGKGSIRTQAVRDAFTAVPRHAFLPDHPVEDAYANKYIVTHSSAIGEAISSASQPDVVAMMLEQLDVHPGMRVLEIGAGTGYNAALMDDLVGPAGAVVTIDIESEVTAAARIHLAATGHGRVRVITGDGALGAPDEPSFDRIIATTGVWDIPPAWWDQVAQGGRMVIPLRWRGLTRSLTLDEVDGRLVSREARLCGFIPMQSQTGERSISLADGVTLHFDEDTPTSAGLGHALDQARVEEWSGVEIDGQTPLQGMWMRLACTEPGTGRMVTKPPTLGTGLVSPAIPPLDPALIRGESLAYLSIRPLGPDRPGSELGAVSHGPEGGELARRVCDQVRAWNLNRDPVPQVTVYRAGTPDSEIGEGERLVIDKTHTRVLVTTR